MLRPHAQIPGAGRSGFRPISRTDPSRHEGGSQSDPTASESSPTENNPI